MESFLEKCVDKILQAHNQRLGEVCIVLPNRRAGLFLKKYFSKKINKPVFLPEVFSIEDFITALSGLNIVDPLNLLFEFYEVHKEINQKEDKGFEAFTDWAPSALRDFNEADEYLVDTDSLFGFLTDAKAIELWDPANNKLTDFERNYLHFYRSLQKYFEKLNQRLLSKKLAYQGAAYRFVAENIENIAKDLGYEMVYFCGFNALTSAEDKLISRLTEIKKAEVLWDADHYYLDWLHQGSRQEAGKFLREHLNKTHFKKEGNITDQFKSPKEIEMIGVPQNIGQAKVCGEIISQLPDPGKLDDTAVILADESMLIPVLNSIPEETPDLNITMGFPLEHVPLFSLFERLFLMNKNAEGIRKLRGKKDTTYYLKDILALMRHPVLQANTSALFGLSQGEYTSVGKELIHSNKALIERKEVLAFFPGENNEFVSLLLRDWKNQTETALSCLFKIIDHLRKSISKKGKKGELMLEYLFHFALIFKKLNSLQENYQSISSAEELWKVLRLITRTASIPFYGEPLRGLQLMGMLETRTLDFERIILLSCNEGILPSARMHDSFIPFDIKIKFGLPTYRDRDAIYAYHFYRLLQRAKKIHLLYNTEAGQLGGGDKSRFLSQLEKELPVYNPEAWISKKIFSLDIEGISLKTDIVVEKTAIVMEKIQAKALNGFSASSLNKFRKCPLQFYFSELAGLKEEDEIGENIDAASLGTLIHKSLQNLYKSYSGQELDMNSIESIKGRLGKELLNNFRKQYPGGQADFGKNLLILKAAESLMQNIVGFDQTTVKNSSLRILHLEEEIRTFIGIENGDMPEKILLKGFIDRIDEMDGSLRLLDYKTGFVDSRELGIRSDSDTTDPAFSDIAFQLLFYAYIYAYRREMQADTFQSAVLSLKRSKNAFVPLSVDKNNTLNTGMLEFFHSQLSDLLKRIFSKDEKFRQTKDIKTCDYCSFKDICNR